MPAATIFTLLSALVAGGVDIGTSISEAQALGKAGEEARRLSERERQDALKTQQLGLAQTRRAERFQEKQFRFTEQEAKKDRSQWQKQFDYQKRQNMFNNALGLINNNAALQQRFAQIMIPGRRI